MPHTNLYAIGAFFLGVFGLVPFIGVFLAIPAIILGIYSLKKRKQDPMVKGAIHAWIGIIFGGISLGYHALVILLIPLLAR